MKKKTLLLSVTVLAAVLLTRELGFIDFSFYRSRRDTSSSQQSLGGLPAQPLTTEEEGHRGSWRSAEISRHRIYYTEECVYPWTRWIPLVKFGTTKISRKYLVTSDEGKVLWGTNAGEVSLTVFGSLSARKYSELAEGDDRKAFIRMIETTVLKQPNQSLQPTAPSGRG